MGRGGHVYIVRNLFQLAAFQVFIVPFSSRIPPRNFPTPFLPSFCSSPPSFPFLVWSRYLQFSFPSSFFPSPSFSPSDGKGMAEAKPVVCSKGRFDLVSQRVEEGEEKKEKRREEKKRKREKKEVKGVEIPFSSWTFAIFFRPYFPPPPSLAATSVNRDCATREELVETLIA